MLNQFQRFRPPTGTGPNLGTVETPAHTTPTSHDLRQHALQPKGPGALILRLWIEEMKSASVLLGVVVAVCMFSVIARGQGSASVRGHVTDPSGAVIANAMVRLVRTDTNATRATKTDSEGFYEFVQLASGAYQVTVAAPGFATGERTDLNLIVNVPVTADFHLPVATTGEKVEVMSSAPMLNTTDATLGEGFDTNQVSQLPIEGRNVVELLSLQPGVTYLGNRLDEGSETRSGAVNG